MSRFRIAVLSMLLVLACTSSVMAWASPVVLKDWTVRTPAGLFGIRRVGYDLGQGGPLQKDFTEVHLGPLGETTPTIAASAAMGVGLLIFLVFYVRRSKLDPHGRS